jgi:hypothetical protein
LFFSFISLIFFFFLLFLSLLLSIAIYRLQVTTFSTLAGVAMNDLLNWRFDGRIFSMKLVGVVDGRHMSALLSKRKHEFSDECTCAAAEYGLIVGYICRVLHNLIIIRVGIVKQRERESARLTFAMSTLLCSASHHFPSPFACAYYALACDRGMRKLLLLRPKLSSRCMRRPETLGQILANRSFSLVDRRHCLLTK